MVILGVDYGDVRTGLALCDRGEMLARPAGVICEPGLDKTVKAVSYTHLLISRMAVSPLGSVTK